MSRILATLLAGAALIGTASVANATVISGGTAGISATLTDYSTSLGTLNKFDTTLGTLNSITFTTTYGFTSTITVTTGTASSGDTATVSAAQFSSGDDSINAVLNNLVNTYGDATIGASDLNPAAYRSVGRDRVYSVGANATMTYQSNSADSTQTATDSNSADFTPFEAAGGGTFGVNAATLTGTTGTTTGGNATITQSTFADQSVSVSYNYTAPPPAVVPEPASMALLGAGLLGAGLVRRRK